VAINLLSNTACTNATCPRKISVRKLHDGGGLYLWVFPDGSKYWRLRYRQQGKEKLLALGVYPRVGLKDARARRDAAQKQLEAGQDPAEARKAERQRQQTLAANSFEAVAREWFGNQTHTWTQVHVRDVKRRLESNIFPATGARPIDQ
jgi:hypothetical protein